MHLPQLRPQKSSKSRNQYIQYPLTTTAPTHATHQPSFPPSLSLTNPQHSPSPSQQKPNPFLALHQLKSTQQHYDMLKKRMQVLKLKHQKNNNRYQMNNRKLVLHQSIQKLSSLEKDRLEEWKKANYLRMEEQRIVNLKEKLEHHRFVQSTFQSLKQTKFRQYQKSKQTSKYHQQRIQQTSQQSLQSNKQKVQQIKQLQQMTKMSIQSFNKQKSRSFRERKNQEVGWFESKKVEREEEIRRMVEMEMEMIERQSRSRLMVNRSQQKLKQVLNPQYNLMKSSRINRAIDSPLPNTHPITTPTTTNIPVNIKPDSPRIQPKPHDGTKDSSFSYTQQKTTQMKKGFSLPQIVQPSKKLYRCVDNEHHVLVKQQGQQ